MSTTTINSANGKSTTVQKNILAILVRTRLFPPPGVRLVCDTLKCTTFQALWAYRICVRGQKCNSCKEATNCCGKCAKQRICDEYLLRKKRCKCVAKKYCVRCKKISVQKSCSECEKMPPKCNSESKSFIL